MGLDDRLLNDTESSSEDKQTASASRAGALNEAKRGGQNNETSESNEEPQSLREAVQAEKKEQAGQEEEADDQSVVGGLAKKAVAPMRKGTSRLLRGAWESLIETGGLSVIGAILWANIHVFLGVVLGNNIFCKLGEEWSDAKPIPAKLPGEDKAIKAVGTGEKMGLACVDLGCLFSCLFQLAIIAMIVGFIENPFRAIIAILKSIFTNWNSLK